MRLSLVEQRVDERVVWVELGLESNNVGNDTVQTHKYINFFTILKLYLVPQHSFSLRIKYFICLFFLLHFIETLILWFGVCLCFCAHVFIYYSTSRSREGLFRREQCGSTLSSSAVHLNICTPGESCTEVTLLQICTVYLQIAIKM